MKINGNYNPTKKCNILEDLMLMQHSYANLKSYCVVFEVMITSSLVDEYTPFGAIITLEPHDKVNGICVSYLGGPMFKLQPADGLS
jgi:hypothetical protein